MKLHHFKNGMAMVSGEDGQALSRPMPLEQAKRKMAGLQAQVRWVEERRAKQGQKPSASPPAASPPKPSTNAG